MGPLQGQVPGSRAWRPHLNRAVPLLMPLCSRGDGFWVCSPAQRLPDLLMALGDLSPLQSATLMPLLRELLLLKSSCPPPCQESSRVRELSICLFKEIIQIADWKHKWQMQKVARESLVPLVLHMSDETESVAEASYEALCVAAKVLKWKRLSHRVRVLERERTVECLLEHDWSRAEKYVRQSMRYLQHAQVTVRVAAVRFIGLVARYLKNSSRDTLREIYDGE
ncbi:uncharacterized protein PRD47_015551 isoform 3-T3 [Ara ararauna]